MIGIHNGRTELLRQFARSVESFSAEDAAKATGWEKDRVFSIISRESDIFAYGGCGGRRRYTMDKALADRVDAELAEVKRLEYESKRIRTQEQMNRRLGRVYGAPKDMDDILLRCDIDPDSGCILWKGSLSTGGGKVPYGKIPGERRTRSMVRAVWEMKHGHIPRDWIVWRTCTDKRCLNVKHMLAGTRADYGRWLAETGKFKRHPSYMAANKRIARARAKITPEIAAQIRMSDKPLREWAAELGVAFSAVAAAKRAGDTSMARNSSVFSWRP